MQAATILIILLSHQGYWFGGQDQTISVAWPVDQKMPAANLQWELMLGQARLTGDQMKMPDGKDPAMVKLKIPPVRTRTQLRWVYKVTASDGGKTLASGERILNVFPAISLSCDIAPRMAGKKLFIVDEGKDLESLLAAAKIDATRVDNLAALQSAQADIILVAANQVSDSPFVQAPLLAQVRSGAQAIVFEQSQPKNLCGYALSRKPVTSNLSWRAKHPLFEGLDENDLKSWLSGVTTDLWAIRLPTDEPALEIVYWPREIAGEEPAPIDALVAVTAMGKGRLVLSQIPLQDWRDDPRTQLFLQNALNYLLTRPEPTPRPSERPTTQPAAVQPVPTITIPSGDLK